MWTQSACNSKSHTPLIRRLKVLESPAVRSSGKAGGIHGGPSPHPSRGDRRLISTPGAKAKSLCSTRSRNHIRHPANLLKIRGQPGTRIQPSTTAPRPMGWNPRDLPLTEYEE
jgi:hypothetical protein